jgi:hypothetical protein
MVWAEGHQEVLQGEEEEVHTNRIEIKENIQSKIKEVLEVDVVEDEVNLQFMLLRL